MRLELNEHLAREMQIENRVIIRYLFTFKLITDETIKDFDVLDENFRVEVAQLQVRVYLQLILCA